MNEDGSSSVGDIDRFVIIRNLLEFRHQLHRDYSSVRLPTQVMTSPGSWSGWTLFSVTCSPVVFAYISKENTASIFEAKTKDSKQQVGRHIPQHRISEECSNLYISSSIFRVIKSRWMKWTGHVARMIEMHTEF
jgi:hypothetical protein